MYYGMKLIFSKVQVFVPKLYVIQSNIREHFLVSRRYLSIRSQQWAGG